MVISLSGHLSGSISSHEGDIVSTQNLLISFKPITCKLNYSHTIIEVIVRLIDAGGIAKHQCLTFLFIR